MFLDPGNLHLPDVFEKFVRKGKQLGGVSILAFPIEEIHWVCAGLLTVLYHVAALDADYNLAIGRATSQSSYNDNTRLPQMANDGAIDWCIQYTAMTTSSYSPWWSVNIGRRVNVQRVVVVIFYDRGKHKCFCV